MNRRDFMAASAAMTLFRFDGCSTEHNVIAYARILAVAAGSIGMIVERTQQVLGERIRHMADAVLAAIEAWRLEVGTGGMVINVLQSLRVLLETLPLDAAATVASLIPIAIAAIEAILRIIPPLAASGYKPPTSNLPVNFHPIPIPHKWGRARERDFIVAWDEAARRVTGAVVFP